MRLLITGMSGVGKTTTVGALRALGFRAIDMDAPGWVSFDEFGNQRWDVNSCIKQATAERLALCCKHNSGFATHLSAL